MGIQWGMRIQWGYNLSNWDIFGDLDVPLCQSASFFWQSNYSKPWDTMQPIPKSWLLNMDVDISCFPLKLLVRLPSGELTVAIEHGPVEIVDFPMKNDGSFHCKLLVHQRVVGIEEHGWLPLSGGIPWETRSYLRLKGPPWIKDHKEV